MTTHPTVARPTVARPTAARPRGVLAAATALTVATSLAVAAPSAGTAGDASAAGGRLVRTGYGAQAAQPAPGTFTGEGFDACSAPSTATMQAWAASPYRAIGVYIGGVNRGCTQPNLTAAWVSAQQAAGWHLIPIYVGLQAPCTTSTKPHLIDPASALAQGRASADDAVVQARALGLPPESVIVYDMEAYRTDDAACRQAVQTFVSAWTARLHDRSYLSGFYSSMASGVADQVAVYNSGAHVHPDYLDFARWDGVATVDDPAIPAAYWTPRRRVKQYRGGHVETWGGVPINIDNDYVDVAPAPATPFGDFTGNGWSDLLTRDRTSGDLRRYAGNGSYVTGPARIGVGWGGMSAIVRFGDVDGGPGGDGREDVIARQASNGDLWLYPWAGSGFGPRVKIGVGWNAMREITLAGDLDRDGYPDLLAVASATGELWAYPGRGVGFRPRVSLGTGWNTMDELTGVGDADRDGFPDLIARHTASGDLYLYPGRGLGFAPRVRIGVGWGGMRDLTGIGDLDRDGFPDLVTVQKSTGYLLRYRGRGGGVHPGVLIGTGWTNQQPLL